MNKHILTEQGEFEVDGADGLRLTPSDMARVTGWTLKPEGLCRGEICVPMPGALVEGRIDVAAFWERLGQPAISDQDGQAWVLGTGAAERRESLSNLQAPDFELPD